MGLAASQPTRFARTGSTHMLHDGSRTDGRTYTRTILGPRRAPWKSSMPADASVRHLER